MAKEKISKAQPVSPSEVSFVCKFCGQTKPLSELTLQTRFFPVLTACRDCERALQSLKIEDISDASADEDDEVEEEAAEPEDEQEQQQ